MRRGFLSLFDMLLLKGMAGIKMPLRDRDSRSTELVTYLKQEAQAKRDRRKLRNLDWGGYK